MDRETRWLTFEFVKVRVLLDNRSLEGSLSSRNLRVVDLSQPGVDTSSFPSANRHIRDGG